MNRIDAVFAQKKKPMLSVYFTAGFPTLDKTVEIIKTLDKKGVDMIEIGIPFSDPMADGKVIQASSTQALKNGMSLKVLFEQLRDIRKETQIPLLLMGYLNPIISYGFEEFCIKCREVGIDGLIIPDLPVKEYLEKYQSVLRKYSLKLTMLITPETTEDRIRMIDEQTDGFIYMVSTASTTGMQDSFSLQTQEYFKRIDEMGLSKPRMIGFGISGKDSFNMANSYSNGAIVGSLFVNLLASSENTEEAVSKLIASFY